MALVGGAGSAGGLGATVSAAMPWIAGASAVAGTVGAVRQGQAAEQAAEYEAKQMERAGDEAFAEGQQRAKLAQRQRDMALGRARAMGAASGAGQSESVLEGIIEQGDYNTMVEWYGARSKRSTFYGNAASTLQSGKNAKTASYLNAASAAGKSASSIYDIYY